MFNKEIKNKYSALKALFSIAFLVTILFPFTTDAQYYNYNNYYNQPSITTSSATNIDYQSATLNGSVNSNDPSTHVWFQYGTDTYLASSTASYSYNSGLNNNVSQNIYDLAQNTVYYFRVVAQNSNGTMYGNILSFRTTTNYNYYPNGNYNNNYYNNNVVNTSNCYTYPNYYSNNRRNNYYYNGGYYNNVTCFPSTNTYSQYYGSNNYASGSAAPTALTLSATSVGSYSAQMNATILNNTNDPSNAWFEWGTTEALGNTTASVYVGASPSVNHVDTITGLAPNTTYYFRAVAENSVWRNNGSILSFTTGYGPVASPSIIYYQPAPQTQSPPATVNNGSQNTMTNPTPASVASPLGASVLGANAFFPDNIIGWMVLIILILILVMLIRHPQVLGGNSHSDHNSQH